MELESFAGSIMLVIPAITTLQKQIEFDAMNLGIVVINFHKVRELAKKCY